MYKLKYIAQTQETECGLCCVAMMLNYFGCDLLPREMKESQEIGRDGMSLQQMMNILKDYNMEADIYEAGINRLSDILHFPLILYWENSHFVILKKIKNKKYYITDPGLGEVVLNRNEFIKKYSNLALVSKPGLNFKKKVNKRNNFGIFWEYFLQYKFNFILLLILSLAFSLSSLFVPMYISQLSKKITENTFLNDPFFLAIIGLVPLFTCLYFLRAQIVLKNIKEMDVSNYHTITKKLFELPFFYFKSRNSSTILFRLSLLKNNREMILDTIFSGLLDILMVIVLLISISIFSLESFLVIIGISIVFGIILYILRKKLLVKYKSELNKYTQLQSLEYETFSSLFSIKASSQETYMHKLLQKKNKDALDFFVERTSITNIYSTIIYFISTFGAISVLLISLILNPNNISISQLIFIFTISGVYFSSFSTLFDTINTIGLLKNNMLHINDILDQESEKEDNIKVRIEKIESIEFKNVYFKYPGQNQYLLKNLSFTMNNNQKIGIVGQTGSGKSTIVGLLLGIYKPNHGNVYINGIDINHIDLKSYRSVVGFVPQEPFVYNKTIKENVTMSREINDQKIYEALKKAEILKDILKMPLGINTIISEMGSNISGGQKQRIIIARAIANNPNVLILDEATSSLDNFTQQNINKNINDYIDMQVIISHRLKTVIDCHKLVFLVNGQIEEVGKYDEIIQKNKKFQEFVGEIE